MLMTTCAPLAMALHASLCVSTAHVTTCILLCTRLQRVTVGMCVCVCARAFVRASRWVRMGVGVRVHVRAYCTYCTYRFSLSLSLSLLLASVRARALSLWTYWTYRLSLFLSLSLDALDVPFVARPQLLEKSGWLACRVGVLVRPLPEGGRERGREGEGGKEEGGMREGEGGREGSKNGV